MDKWPGADIIKRGFSLRNGELIVYLERRLIEKKCDIVCYVAKQIGVFSEKELKEFFIVNIKNILKFVHSKIEHMVITFDSNLFSEIILQEMALELMLFYPPFLYFRIKAVPLF